MKLFRNYSLSAYVSNIRLDFNICITNTFFDKFYPYISSKTVFKRYRK